MTAWRELRSASRPTRPPLWPPRCCSRATVRSTGLVAHTRRGCSGGRGARAADGAHTQKIASHQRRSSSRAPRCSLVVSHLGRGLDPICRGIDGPLPLLAPPSTSRSSTSAPARLKHLPHRCHRGLAWHLRTPRPAGRQQLAARGHRDRPLLQRGPAVGGAGLPAIAAQRGRRAILR